MKLYDIYKLTETKIKEKETSANTANPFPETRKAANPLKESPRVAPVSFENSIPQNGEDVNSEKSIP